jgi:hypothetical protein
MTKEDHEKNRKAVKHYDRDRRNINEQDKLNDKYI